MKLNNLFILFTFLIILIANNPIWADQDIISVFPLERYNQKISHWINPQNPDYDKPLIPSQIQSLRVDEFYSHYFSIDNNSHSPWNPNYINQILHHAAPDDLNTLEQSVIKQFSNKDKSDNEIGYGENFRPYSSEWIEKIADNMNISQFNTVLNFSPANRGIAVDNLHARVLPTDDVHFFSYKIAGQGYPFDNLDMSSLWAGTPVYILGQTKDQAWLLVVTPDYIAWVKSSGIARTSSEFVNTWQIASKNHLVAITKTATPLIDLNSQYLLTAYVGSVFPGEMKSSRVKIMVPVANDKHQAVIRYSVLSTDDATLMPLTATPHHFAMTMETLIGRPYGWGNAYFYNDCSSELKSLYTPFGIWLPRHSSNQVYAGKMVDMSSSNIDERITYLMQQGHKLTTIIYIGGHIIMYAGSYLDITNHPFALTYQNMWGLSPKTADRRVVIGKSVLFPLLKSFPEDSSLISQASKKYFQVSFLDEPPQYLKKFIDINLKDLICP